MTSPKGSPKPEQDMVTIPASPPSKDESEMVKSPGIQFDNASHSVGNEVPTTASTTPPRKQGPIIRFGTASCTPTERKDNEKPQSPTSKVSFQSGSSTCVNTSPTLVRAQLPASMTTPTFPIQDQYPSNTTDQKINHVKSDRSTMRGDSSVDVPGCTPSSPSFFGPPIGTSSNIGNMSKPDTPPGRGTHSAPNSPPPVISPFPYTVSPIDSATSHRDIRTIVHNAFAAEQAEAEALSKRLRTYFVATDLSEEGAHALEWTIGRFLRDGDTLLAIYAVEAGESDAKSKKDKEKATDSRTPTSPSSSGKGNVSPSGNIPINASRAETPPGLPIGSGGVAMLDAQDTIRKLNSREEATILRRRARSRSASGSAPGSRNHTPSSRDRIRPPTKAEQLRLHALRLLTQICTRALAKTDVKVQIAIEVIHCKSPKHMITEAIDTLEPTLVILGSRGRSALKGVLLGSFSNYLVTKSSVPVLVARKQSSVATSKPPSQVPVREPQRSSTHPRFPHLWRHAGNQEDRAASIPNKLVTARVD